MSLSYANVQDRIEQFLCSQFNFQFLNFKGLLSNSLLSISQFLFKNGIRNMIDSIWEQLQILNPVIIFDAILMMHYFPRQKASPQMLSHNKAMLWYITSSTNHRIKEVIRLQPQLYITSDKKSTTFPHRILLFPKSVTVSTMQAYGFTFINKNPTCLPTGKTCVPNYLSCRMRLVTYCSTILNCVSNFRHTSIITYLKELFNEPFICKLAR